MIWDMKTTQNLKWEIYKFHNFIQLFLMIISQNYCEMQVQHLNLIDVNNIALPKPIKYLN